MPTKARKPHRRREALPLVTVRLREDETIPPQVEAARQWLAAALRATLARQAQKEGGRMKVKAEG